MSETGTAMRLGEFMTTTGATERQVNWWATSGLFSAAAGNTGSGRPRLFDDLDVVLGRVAVMVTPWAGVVGGHGTTTSSIVVRTLAVVYGAASRHVERVVLHATGAVETWAELDARLERFDRPGHLTGALLVVEVGPTMPQWTAVLAERILVLRRAAGWQG